MGLNVRSDLALFSGDSPFLGLAVDCIEATLRSLLMADQHHQHVLPLRVNHNLGGREEERRKRCLRVDSQRIYLRGCLQCSTV